MSLLSAAAVRERANDVLEAGLAGALSHFRVEPAALSQTADFVASVIRERYPTLTVPLHARWRHFVFGGRDLWAEIVEKAAWADAAARARSEIDLAIISVLLDAGAGADWRYRDAVTGLAVGRSEGLALASLRMFAAGLFSSDPRDPLRADAQRLAALTEEELGKGLGVDERNPIAGLAGRAALLARLGRVALANQAVFAACDGVRPGGLFDYLAGMAANQPLSAPALLYALLTQLAPIWPSRRSIGGVPLGDTWRHPAVKRNDATNELVPLHKLSQWLAYSLIEPVCTAGVAVTAIDELTGLAEYRNGGLFVDTGVLVLREPEQALRQQSVDSELIVEWRALTVALLDRLLPLVRERLDLPPQDFPLASLLEGGTWAAGRKIASEKRAGGRPPFDVISDGTVF